MGGLSFSEYLTEYQDSIRVAIQQHALLSLYSIITATIIGLLIAIATYRWKAAANLTISTVSVSFTLPSVALFGLSVSLVGATLAAVFPVLVLYALLPIVRNGIVGLQSADANVLDAARGMGVGRFRMLWQIELPIAWPILLAGIRVSAQLTVGIVAIAAFVMQIGLGQFAYSALSSLGSVNSKNEALVCVLFVTAIALIFDAVFVVLRRFTTPRGSHV